ncbi:hypothetical protein [uncultured Chryseobacterium sp.]|uniref:hypothetical protein n=1 Tax=uncultured Chryseobacterium sp. TaxID=259322 RepID=UPI0025903C46|nr:hypothetical protein [uncultured Chryseobacterium sp.]
MEEIEEKFYQLVKEQYVRTGGANGLSIFSIDEKLGVSISEIRQAVENLLKKNKIAKLNHLNGTSYTLPK